MGSDDKRGSFDGARGYGKPHGGKPFGKGDGRRGGGSFRGDGSRGGHRTGKFPGDKPRGGGKPFGGPRDDRKPFGGSRSDKPFGDKPRGGRSFDGSRGGGKPFGGRGGAPQRDDARIKKPRVARSGNYKELKYLVECFNGRGYSSYKELFGSYEFDGFTLSVDHVQSDPFAAPSRLTVRVPQDVADFPADLFSEPWRLVALEDAITRKFSQVLGQNACRFADFIKGGTMSSTRPGPEILKRSACSVTEEAVEMRFEASFPSRDRSVAAMEFSEMIIEALPRCVREALLYVSYDAAELQAVSDLADDQHALREEIARRDWVCFVADGAVLPRESGVSSRPMQDARPFSSPESMRVSVELPHAGTVTGMAVPRGVTLVVGGGYHGKSTLLKAIESGVYDHVAGDGREFVACDETAVKLRAEDGRSVRDADISLFINNLPNGADTTSFWSDDASGSTSQAASTVEAIEAGARVFLIDEDTSATNFMVRDELMQAVIAREDEPITPFVERVRDLYERAGISTVIVAGSSGAFFSVADTVIQMDSYEPHEITAQVRETCRARGAQPVRSAAGFAMPNRKRMLVSPPHPLKANTASDARKESAARREGRASLVPERVKTKVFSGVEIAVGSIGADMRFVEQLVDAEQTQALAQIVRWCFESDSFARCTVREMVDAVFAEMESGGLCAVTDRKVPAGGFALPRRQEVFACLNRLRPRS